MLKIKKRLLFGALAFSFLTGCSNNKSDREDLLYQQEVINASKYDFDSNVDTYYEEEKELQDEDEINIPSDYKLYVLDALNKDSNDVIKVKDLKRITSLELVLTDQDLSWVNYCKDLRELSLKYAYDTDVSKYIKELPSLEILSIENVGVIHKEFNDLEFGFAKDITSLKIKRNVDLDMEYLKSTSVNTLEVVSSFQNRINYKELDFLTNLILDPNDEQPYNTAIYFTNDDKEYLLSKGVNVVSTDKIDEINDKLDSINASLGIAKNEMDLPKYKKIVTYVINNMHYGDLDEEQTTDKYYKNGYLRGALDEDTGAICGNYSALVEALCLRNGIDSYILSSGREGKHCWNLVKIANKYHYSDITNMDILKCIDESTNEEISVEEFVSRYGVRDMVLPYFMFDVEDSGKMYKYTYLPREYMKYVDEHAEIYISSLYSDEETKKLTYK